MLFIALCYIFVGLPFLVAITQNNTQYFIQLVKALVNVLIVLGLTIGGIWLLTGHVIQFSDGLFQKRFLLKFMFMVTVIQFGVVLAKYGLQKVITISIDTNPKKVKRFNWSVLCGALLVATGYFLLAASFWTKANFGLLTPEQIVFNLRQPMEGVDGGFINSFIGGPLLGGISCLLIVFLFCNYALRLQLVVTRQRPLKLMPAVFTSI